MRHLSSFMQHELVLALGWTLIHSLWQGLLLALVTGIMLLATRKSESQKRYELLTGLFLLFIAVTGITFARELYLAIARPGFRPLANIAAGRSVISTIIPFTDSHIVVNRSWASRLKDYFNQHAYLIVTIWFIIFVARFIKLIAEVAYIQRLKNYRTSEPPEAWKNRLKDLMEKMSVNTYVQFLESGIVKVPVVMGILKPVILLPLGLLSQLPPDEIEAILLHELAHIRRRDYLVNLVQSFAETLFFFNPAVMWLSSLIREERENCCDDMAISVTNNKTKFIDALISFQEFDLNKPSFTMGFPGRKHQLLNRVKRIISKRNKTLNTTEKSILTLSMAILIMFSFVAAKNIPASKIRKKLSFYNAPATTPSFNKPDEQLPGAFAIREKAETVSSSLLTGAYTPVLHESIDTTPVQQTLSRPLTIKITLDSASDFKSYSTDVSNDGSTKILTIHATHRHGTEYRLKKINDAVVEFSVNGKEIPSNEFHNYQETIDAVERPYEGNKARAELDASMSSLKNTRLTISKLDTLKIKLHPQEYEADKLNNPTKLFTKSKLEIKQKSEEIYLKRKADSLKQELRLTEQKLSQFQKQQSINNRNEQDKSRVQLQAIQIRNIINDLEKENLKVDLQKSWFALDESRFIVDGKTMSPELHLKFKTKYLKPKNTPGYFYGPVQLEGRGIFLDYGDLNR